VQHRKVSWGKPPPLLDGDLLLATCGLGIARERPAVEEPILCQLLVVAIPRAARKGLGGPARAGGLTKACQGPVKKSPKGRQLRHSTASRLEFSSSSA